MATAFELESTRKLISSIDAENAALRARLDTEKRNSMLLSELNETLKMQSEALQAAVAAKNEALAAKDLVIASQDKLIRSLNKRKDSPWRRVGYILTGAAVALIFK